MKKVLLLLTLTTISFVWAQEDYLDDYNTNHTTNTAGDEIITNEPFVIAEITGTTNPEFTDNNPDQDMTASAEAMMSKFYKKLNIPVWYRWKEFSFNATLPYFLSREETWSGNTASGLGDISIGAGYGKYLPDHNLYLDTNVNIKLPTGNDEADAGDGVKISLTTETTDITGALSAYYFMDEFTFRGNIIYTMNGTFEDDFDNETDRGDDFILNAGADYRWQYNLTFGLNANYGIHFASEFNGDEDNTKTIFMDIKPVVKYPISLFEFVVGAKIPLYTDIPDDDFNDGNRNMSFFFRTNYRIF
ncbi:MAG: transporter [Candidatus Delongbacteria bacterium]|nr:transporter [Candidatus Delongbacteria bacterium]